MAGFIRCNGVHDQVHKFTVMICGSGWYLVRGIPEIPKTFSFASTTPFYVKVSEVKRRIIKASSRFFFDWVNERIELVNGGNH